MPKQFVCTEIGFSHAGWRTDEYYTRRTGRCSPTKVEDLEYVVRVQVSLHPVSLSPYTLEVSMPTLGTHGPAVPALGMGGAWVQRIPDSQALASVDGAWEAGTRYYDTAPW